jgi:hypothetical protein
MSDTSSCQIRRHVRYVVLRHKAGCRSFTFDERIAGAAEQNQSEILCLEPMPHLQGRNRYVYLVLQRNEVLTHRDSTSSFREHGARPPVGRAMRLGRLPNYS